MTKKLTSALLVIVLLLTIQQKVFAQKEAAGVLVGAEYVDRSLFKDREVLPDISGKPDPGMVTTLVHVRGNLYRHTVDTIPVLHSGLVLITKEGALVIDPVKTQAAIQLNEEIKKRFNVPVKYVVLTHAHYDHIGGSQIFQQAGAKVIIQKKGLEPIIGEKLPVAVPDIVYDKQLTINLGGETVIVSHIAPSHSNNMSVVLFPKYKAMQLTDVGESKTMPYNDFLDFHYDGWIETLDWALKQDVDYIDVGHYTPATLDDIRKERAYLVDLHQQVLDLVRKGQCWDELYRNVKFAEEVKKWGGFESMHILNILGMYRWVSNHRRGVW